MKTKKYITILVALVIILLIEIIISIAFGSANISTLEAFKIVLSKIPIINNFVDIQDIPSSFSTIILNIRLPRIMLAGLVGMGLAACGAVYQGTLKNNMADPYILGVSAGASLGATIGIILNIPSTVKIFAFIGAIAVTAIVYFISKNTHNKNSTFIILTGINVNYFITAIVSMLMIANKDQLDKIVFWTMGSLSTSMWQDVIILAIIEIPLIIILTILAKYINAIALDEVTAKNTGINTSLIRGIIILVTCLITALCVSMSGIIGFVGLMVPHIVRILFTSNYKYLIPISSILGAIFLILSDNIARTIMSPTEIPIGIITSIIGAPYLIYLIYKKKAKYNT